MIGQPKYKVGDKVTFKIDGQIAEGSIYIVDEYGTFFIDDDVCYDVMANWCGKESLFKHIPERWIISR